VLGQCQDRTQAGLFKELVDELRIAVRKGDMIRAANIEGQLMMLDKIFIQYPAIYNSQEK